MQSGLTFDQILENVNSIFKDVLENDDIVVNNNTTAKDIPEWDSLSPIALVVTIEKNFKIKFTAKEIQDFKNVGEMCEGIGAKLGGNS